MRLFCLTNYYDEPGLADAITDALDCGCTDVILLDGAYRHYPHLTPTSPVEQAQAVIELCARRNVRCVHTTAVGATETEKRTMLFDLAYQQGATEHDWLFVMDADQTITNKRDLKPLLANAKRDVFDTMVLENDNTRYDEITRRRWVRQTMRAIPGLHVDPDSHWRYLDAQGRIIWGYNAIPANGDLPILIHNNSTTRQHQRSKGRDAYYQARQDAAVEQELPPSTCYHCDQPPTCHIRTDLRFELAPDGNFGTSNRRSLYVCDQHLAKVKARNTYELEQQARQALNTNPALAAAWVARMGGGSSAKTHSHPRIAPSQIPPPNLADGHAARR
jgi:hypothetical protein